MTESRDGILGTVNRSHQPGGVALVHDYLLVMRGAERAFAGIASIWPDAPIYTLLYDREGTWGRFASREVRTSPLQRLGARQGRFRALLPLLPWATEQLSLEGYRLVVSSSSAFAHGVKTDPGATHVCYCYTPMRYAWHERAAAIGSVPLLLRPAVRRVLDRNRRWDLDASRRVDHYVAISELTRQRIQDLYGREASVIHPPVETGRFTLGEPGDYLLFVGELVAHKRVEVALEAARRAGRPIKIVGEGPERRRLEGRYGSSAEFLGRVPDGRLPALFAGALALVVPNVEEFGIAAVESQAAGRPVVATDVGGVRETVVDGETGVLVPGGEVEQFAAALHDTDFARFEPAKIKQHAERFSTRAFQERFRAEVQSVLRGSPGGPA